MTTIGGFDAAVLAPQVFDRLPQFTAGAIREGIAAMRARVDAHRGVIHLSLGETCGPAVKLREAGLPGVGSGYFDNLVAPLDAVCTLLETDFAGILRLPNLVVGRWEDQDSVLDEAHGVYFHHYFHPRDFRFEKSDHSEGHRRRRIDPGDVPLFLPEVLARFEYLQAKMRHVLRAPLPKCAVVRRADGGPAPPALTGRLLAALDRFGAREVVLRVVHATGEPGPAADAALHRLVPEREERWGDAETWARLLRDGG